MNLLFQARRAGSNPRPSCILRCVAARDKSRPGRRAMARAHQEGCARARPSAWVLNSRCVAARDKSRPWQLAIARAHQENCARARGVAGRGLEKPGILCGAWPHGTSCARGGGLMARAYRESCVRARGVAGRGLEGLSHGGSLAGRNASGLVKIPALDGGKALCWGSLPGWEGRKQVWAELFPR